MSKRAPIIEFAVLGVLGVVWHFIYEWSGKSMPISLVAPINESTWEHLKILFFPFLLYSAIQYFLIKEKPENYLPALASGLFFGMLTIPVFFYTYTGILGYDISSLNILSYYIALAVTLYIKYRIIKNKNHKSRVIKYLSAYFLIRTAILFFWWTFAPPLIDLFVSPV